MILPIRYSDFLKSDFFNFFNFSEILHEKFQEEKELLKLKPGGFREFIDLELILMKGEIIEAILDLDRNWVGDEFSLNPFAKDIVKSFVGTFFPPGVDDEFGLILVQGIWNLKGKKDLVICLDEVVKEWETIDNRVQQFLNVYRGILDKYEIKIDNWKFHMENIFKREKGLKMLNMSFHWKI